MAGSPAWWRWMDTWGCSEVSAVLSSGARRCTLATRAIGPPTTWQEATAQVFSYSTPPATSPDLRLPGSAFREVALLLSETGESRRGRRECALADAYSGQVTQFTHSKAGVRTPIFQGVATEIQPPALLHLPECLGPLVKVGLHASQNGELMIGHAIST